ncbi:InlB B-repeat-containing protein, partial [bacterium]|nr:InlB B-repeat-containing protein [bacterium]
MKFMRQFLFILNIFFLILYLSTPVSVHAQNWSTRLSINGNGMTYSLFFGGHPNATDGIDNSLDVLAPPTPPNPTYNVYFLISHPVFPRLTTDMRAWIFPYASNIVWTLVIENANGVSTQLTWESSSLPPQGNFILNGSINMRTQNSISFTGNQTVTIQYQYVPTQQYNLSVLIDPNGTGTVIKNSDKTSYYQGETVTLTPQATAGYAFSHWSGDVSGSAVPLILTMNGNMTITANFGHSLTIQLEPSEGGSIQKTPSKSVYQHGETVTIRAISNQTFVFNHWDEDVNNTQTQITITMNQNRTLTAHFGHTLTVDIRDIYGSLTDSGTVLINPVKRIYAHNENVQLTAIPMAGWMFNNWSGDASGVDSPLNLTMDRNKFITAVFGEVGQFVTVQIQSEPSGRIIQVDGVKYSTSCSFQWTKNSTHAVGTELYQLLSGEHSRYCFNNWSDYGNRNHSISVTSSFILTVVF